MSIVIVMGLPCAGKSTFIKKNCKDRRIIDVYDFQKNNAAIGLGSVLKSYLECKEELLSAIKNGEDVVLEHTLLRRIRRLEHIQAIREITDAPIDCYFINPGREIINERRKLRGCFPVEDLEYDVLEPPTKDEGFQNVFVITD